MAADKNIVDVLWSTQDKPAAPVRQPLSLPAIAAAAIAIADAEGIDAVSMQRVAGDLGFTKMSLYRYVSSKSDLVAVMIESAVSEPPDLSGVAGGWRAKLEEFVRLLTGAWTRHPWLPWATIGDRVMGPREIGWTESVVSALSDTGLTGGDRLDAALLLFGHIRNTQSLQTAGTQPWAADHRASETFLDAMNRHGARFPALVAALADTERSPSDNGRGFGLDCILDGLAARIAAASTT